eukprot:m.187648 g.187648  ORF g.187648 m.187648 type:complete len:54 (-) comp32311_c2_seq1:250-411(-)
MVDETMIVGGDEGVLPSPTAIAEQIVINVERVFIMCVYVCVIVCVCVTLCACV